MGRLAKTNKSDAPQARDESTASVIRSTKMVSARLDRAFSRRLKSLSIDQGRPIVSRSAGALSKMSPPVLGKSSPPEGRAG